MKYIVPIKSTKSTLLVIDSTSPEAAKQSLQDLISNDYNEANNIFDRVLFDSLVIGDPTEANFISLELCNENHADYPICPKCGESQK